MLSNKLHCRRNEFPSVDVGSLRGGSLPATCATSKQAVRSRCPLFRSVRRLFLQSVGCVQRNSCWSERFTSFPRNKFHDPLVSFVRRLIYFLHNFPVTERHTRKTLPTRLFNNFNTFVSYWRIRFVIRIIQFVSYLSASSLTQSRGVSFFSLFSCFLGKWKGQWVVRGNKCQELKCRYLWRRKESQSIVDAGSFCSAELLESQIRAFVESLLKIFLVILWT